MADWYGIRTAIASNLSGVSGIRRSTADILDNVSMLPEIHVTNITNLDMVDRGAGYEYVEADINGDLYVAQSSTLGRAMADVEPYLEGIRVRLRRGVQLGYTTVVQDSFLRQAEVGNMEIGDETYIGAKLSFRVCVRENITRTAT